ncbi:MAG: class I SAM-dependent methyltransferase [Alphaproteobacteria bacterium]
MIQSITIDHQTYLDTKGQSGFIDTYIFPGGALPSRERFREEAEKAGLAVHEQFGFGHDYERTLVEWLERFDAHLPEVRAMGRDEHFIRLWHYYLASCIASFASERCSVMQAELTRPAHSST